MSTSGEIQAGKSWQSCSHSCSLESWIGRRLDDMCPMIFQGASNARVIGVDMAMFILQSTKRGSHTGADTLKPPLEVLAAPLFCFLGDMRRRNRPTGLPRMCRCNPQLRHCRHEAKPVRPGNHRARGVIGSILLPRDVGIDELMGQRPVEVSH